MRFVGQGSPHRVQAQVGLQGPCFYNTTVHASVLLRPVGFSGSHAQHVKTIANKKGDHFRDLTEFETTVACEMSKCEATFAKQQKRDITMTSKASDIEVAVFGLEDEVRVRWAFLVRRNAKDLPELPCEEEDWFLGQSDGLKMHVAESSSCAGTPSSNSWTTSRRTPSTESTDVRLSTWRWLSRGKS